jgi:hypothetical protein
MSRASQIIEFEGYITEGVFGIFRIIRDLADLNRKQRNRIKPKKEKPKQQLRHSP